MHTRQAPNRLECGCELGPGRKYCDLARRLQAVRARRYRELVWAPNNQVSRRRYDAIQRQLDEHFARNGTSKFTIGVASGRWISGESER